MSKDYLSYVSEYVSKISEDQLETLQRKLQSYFSDDIVEAIGEVSRDRRMESIIAFTNNSQEFYDLIDLLVKKIQERIAK